MAETSSADAATTCPHPAAHRDVFRQFSRLIYFCRACDSEVKNGRSEHRHTSWEDVKASRSDRADNPRDGGRSES